MNTPTPRTDAATYPADCLGKTLVTNRDLARALERELNALTAERDQLRLDCENETKWAAHYLAQSIADKARAERAEANLAALEQCHDYNCRGVVKIADELAAERARLDWVFHNCKVTSDDFTVHDREDLGAAMKKHAK